MRKTVASAVGRVSDAVRGIVGDLNPGTLSGAIDIIVVETPANDDDDSAGGEEAITLQSTSFHVKFGKLQLVKATDRIVSIEVNGVPTNLQMKLSRDGYAYFPRHSLLDLPDGMSYTDSEASDWSDSASMSSPTPPPRGGDKQRHASDSKRTSPRARSLSPLPRTHKFDRATGIDWWAWESASADSRSVRLFPNSTRGRSRWKRPGGAQHRSASVDDSMSKAQRDLLLKGGGALVEKGGAVLNPQPRRGGGWGISSIFGYFRGRPDESKSGALNDDDDQGDEGDDEGEFDDDAEGDESGQNVPREGGAAGSLKLSKSKEDATSERDSTQAGKTARDDITTAVLQQPEDVPMNESDAAREGNSVARSGDEPSALHEGEVEKNNADGDGDDDVSKADGDDVILSEATGVADRGKRMTLSENRVEGKLSSKYVVGRRSGDVPDDFDGAKAKEAKVVEDRQKSGGEDAKELSHDAGAGAQGDDSDKVTSVALKDSTTSAVDVSPPQAGDDGDSPLPVDDPLSPLASASISRTHEHSPSDLSLNDESSAAAAAAAAESSAPSTQRAEDVGRASRTLLNASSDSGISLTEGGALSPMAAVAGAVGGPSRRKSRDTPGGVRSTSVPPEAHMVSPPQEDGPLITEQLQLSLCGRFLRDSSPISSQPPPKPFVSPKYVHPSKSPLDDAGAGADDFKVPTRAPGARTRSQSTKKPGRVQQLKSAPYASKSLKSPLNKNSLSAGDKSDRANARISREELAEIFDAHRVTWEQFCANPSLIFDEDLLVLWQSRVYPMRTFAPLLVSGLAFRRDLPPEVIDRLRSEELTFSSLQAAEPASRLDASLQTPPEFASSRTQSWFSWGTWRSNSSNAAPMTTTLPPASASVSGGSHVDTQTDDVSPTTDASFADLEAPSAVLTDPYGVESSLGSSKPVQRAASHTDLRRPSPERRAKSEVTRSLGDAVRSASASTSGKGIAPRRPQSAEAASESRRAVPAAVSGDDDGTNASASTRTRSSSHGTNTAATSASASASAGDAGTVATAFDSASQPKVTLTAAVPPVNSKEAVRIEISLSQPPTPKTDEKPKRQKPKRPDSDSLRALNLKPGRNSISFSVSSSLQGKQTVSASIYLWPSDSKIVISDVDGTITRSDILGNIIPMIPYAGGYAHSGLPTLFAGIAKNKYKFVYLTSRSIGQAGYTREYVASLNTGSQQLPEGPVIMTPDGLFGALKREVILRRPHEFKIPALLSIRDLFPTNPFFAGFGNRHTDAFSYRAVSVPESRIFIVNPQGQIFDGLTCPVQRSYQELKDMCDSMFPCIGSKNDGGDPEFGLNYWRNDIDDISDSDLDFDDSDDDESGDKKKKQKKTGKESKKTSPAAKAQSKDDSQKSADKAQSKKKGEAGDA